ncbi:MAG: glycosyltransferase [Chloroflexota bacterium]
MDRINGIAKRIGYRVKSRLFYPVTLYPKTAVRGRVLFSYLEQPLFWDDDAPAFKHHSNRWESREIARIFNELGYIVDAVNYADLKFQPRHDYDVVFDIWKNLGRFAIELRPETLKILHSTGSDPYYQNAAELSRVEALNRRRGVNYLPKRIVEDPEAFHASLKAADVCSLIGSAHTLATYPREMQAKIHPVTVSGSLLSFVKTSHDYELYGREFLWFFGYGAVHKGLDIVLEVISQLPHLTLHIVGDVEQEADFMSIYEHEMTQLPNIHFYGHLIPETAEFSRILERSFCFIAPSCSEGISPSVVTCLQAGLFPIISRDTGVVLPSGCGIYLTNCSIEDVRHAILTASEMMPSEITAQVEQTREQASKIYSRENFRHKMQDFLTTVLAQHADHSSQM